MEVKGDSPRAELEGKMRGSWFARGLRLTGELQKRHHPAFESTG
jgi:hypothetical protein